MVGQKSSNKRSVLYFISDFVIIVVFTLSGFTLEDYLHGIDIIQSFADLHQYITPVLIGLIGSLITNKFRQTRKREKMIISEYEKTLNKASESESFFQTLMEQAPSVIEIYDLDGLQIAVNEAYEKLWSFPASTTLNTFNVLKSKEVEKTGLLEYIKRAYAGEYVIVPEYEFDPKGETESKGFGRMRWLSTRIFPLKDSTGKVKNIVITHEDISERKYAEEKIIKAMKKAEESDKLKTIFLANLSHEIRTPMNGIIGFAELLKTPDLIVEKQVKYIDVIKKSGDRMLGIINDLIDISQIESGGIKLNNEIFNCNELMNDLMHFFSEKAADKELQLLQSKPDRKTEICADRNRLSQVMTNLINNAFKFTKKGYINFGYSVNNEIVEFFVEDTGSGIPDEMQKVIFERFRQGNVSSEKSDDGLGLGLAISKSLVEIMGGDIKLESNPRKGSLFRFTIVNNKFENNYREGEQLEFSLEKFYSQKLSILIAEDDEVSFSFFKEFMERTPNILYFARTGKEAVNIYKITEGIDIILMDIKMSEMDGLDAISWIRKEDKNIPIIAQSAFASDQDIENAKNAGANNFITKPIDGNRLISLIQKYT